VTDMIDTDWELLDRYLGGECTPEERDRFEQRLATDPQQREFVEGLRLAGARLPPMPTLVPITTTRHRHDGNVRTHRRWRGLAVAAGLVLAMVARVTTRSRLGILHMARDRSALHTVSTRPAQRAEVRLPDGSAVVLGPASALRYRVPFASGEGGRDVMLSGEAYFGVVHDARRPFRVHAGNTVTEDLGTRFDVRAYADEAAVRVVVADGAVALRAVTLTGTTLNGSSLRARSPVVLEHGSMGLVAASGETTVRSGGAAEEWLAWTQGRLVFVDRPLPEVLPQLSRWYDVDVRLGDSTLATKRLTATFENDPLADVLHAIGRALAVRADQDGRVVRLYSAPPGRHR
jgi:transmembrane sensor